MAKLYGKGRSIIGDLVDPGSFTPDTCGNCVLSADYGPAAVVGSATLAGEVATIISIDDGTPNPRFPATFSGLVGLEEGFKMAEAVHCTMEADRDAPVAQKRPVLLIVDTPGMSPGKIEEIVGIYKSTGAYQLACAQARKAGHPVVAVIVGRAISGGFLCHGLQADRILSLSEEFEPMIHVMPLNAISRITKISIVLLDELSRTNPAFASGVNHFYKLGGVDEIIPTIDDISPYILRHIAEIRQFKVGGDFEATGPWARLKIGAERQGREASRAAMSEIRNQFDRILPWWLGGDGDGSR
jgi:biotin-independent malonate decarboxylase gamma subunit